MILTLKQSVWNLHSVSCLIEVDMFTCEIFQEIDKGSGYKEWTQILYIYM